MLDFNLDVTVIQILYLAFYGLLIYVLWMLIHFLKKGIKAFDIYISKNEKQGD